MSGKLLRLLGSIKNEPQLIRDVDLATIADYLNQRNSGEPLLALPALKQKTDLNGVSFDGSGKIAQIDIMGSLTHRAQAFESMCGMRSYQSLLRDFDAVVEAGAETVVMNIDSGGGEARGAFDTSRALRQKADEAGVKLIAYSDGLIASAAMALASSAHEIVISGDADVGSIGVIAVLTNVSEKLKEDGVEVHAFTAGRGKGAGHPALPFTDEMKEQFQMRVDELYVKFIDLIGEHRGLDASTIEGLGALTYMGQDAVDKGLADKVMSNLEFQDYLYGTEESKQMALELGESTQMSEKENQADLSAGAEQTALQEQLEAMQAQMAEMQEVQAAALAEKEELATKLADFEQKEIEAAEQAKQDQLAAFTAQGEKLGLPENFATLAMAADADLVSMLTDALATSKEQLATSAAMEELGTSEEGAGELSDQEKALELMNQKLKAKYESK